VADLFVVGPYRGELGVAIRAGIAVLVPLLVLVAVGRVDLTLYASFGTFTVLFGRDLPLRPRLRMQVRAGGAQVASVLLGAVIATSPARAWLVIPTAALWATLVAIISHDQRWHPPGPLFPVFALGACSSVPITWAKVPVAFGTTLAAALLAIGITYAAAVLSRSVLRALHRRSHRSLPGGGNPAVVAGGTASRWTLGHYLIRYAIGVAIAGVLAAALPWIGHPYWAMVAAVVPMAAADTGGRLLRAAHRTMGTLLGVLVAWGLLSLHLPAVGVIIVVALLQCGAELLVGRNYGAALLLITPLALLMVQLGHPLPILDLVRDRALETVLGVLVAVVITLIIHERRQDNEEWAR
jgi:hypothetical protein